MNRAILLLAALLAALLGADRWLAGRERARQGSDPAVEPLVAADRMRGATVAAITIGGSGGELVYARKKGVWRSREAHGAVCSEPAVRELLAAFFEARGVARAEGPTGDAEYGFGPGDVLTVSFHGPKFVDAADRDVLCAFEVGRAFREGPRGRAFVREKGATRILEIDRDPRRLLATPLASLLPPLVDARLLAGCLGGGFRGFSEFSVEAPGRERLRVAVDEAARADGADESTTWFLDRGRGKEAFPGWRVGGYIGLWLRGACDETESPSRAAEHGLDPPAAIVRVTPEGGEPIEIWIGAADDRRRARAWNKNTNVVMVVPERWQPLLAPSAEMFLDATRPNPWEEWLKKP